MLKKIILWGLFTACTGLLVFGAIHRTEARTEQVTDTVIKTEQLSSTGDGKERKYNDSRSSDCEPRETKGEGNGQGRIKKEPSFQREKRQEKYSLDDQQEHASSSFSGEVSEYSDDGVVVLTEEGTAIELTRRAWRFAQEVGFEPEVGDQVILSGFFEKDEFEIISILDQGSGVTYPLRESSGRPLWAGSGS